MVVTGGVVALMSALAVPAAQAQAISNSTTTTSLSGGGQSGTTISVAPGVSVTDTATVTLQNGTTPTGTIAYKVYSDPTCGTGLVTIAGGGALVGGVAPPSTAEAFTAPGIYYWEAFFLGTGLSGSSASPCNEIENVVNSPGAPPGPPSCITTATGGTGEITVTWCGPTNPGTAPVQCFQVFRSVGSSPATQIASVCSGSPGFSDPSYTDTSVTCNTTYTYYETSSNTYGTSPPSNTASASAACGSPPPPSAATCSSYSGNGAFVCALYVDILGRAPDSGGLNSWVGALNSGTSRTQVAYAIANSNEYRTDFIQTDYQIFLNRSADAGGMSTWLAAFSSGATDEQVDAGILGSDEFFTDSGSTNNGYINAVYQYLLGRSADSGGISTWTSALNSGIPRTQVAYAIDASNESRTDLIQFFYQLLLNRPADPGGLSTWVGALNSGATDEQVLAAIAGSQEFYNDATGA